MVFTFYHLCYDNILLKDHAFRFLAWLLSHTNSVLVSYQYAPSVMARIRAIKSTSDMLLENNEAYQIYMALRNTAKLGGHVAEVGTYRGGSARLIGEYKGNRPLHLFDTFEGLPKTSAIDNSKFSEGKFGSNVEAVRRYLSGIEGVNLYKGLFPQTAEPIRDKRFSFVHLDADIYQSTKDALEFFYPRMVKGGIIISHDYRNSRGVAKAFDDFFAEKPEPLIELSGTQVLVSRASIF